MADVSLEKSFSESNAKHRPKTSNETMLRDKLRFFVSRISPPSLLPGKKILFDIPRCSLNRGSLNRGSTVIGFPHLFAAIFVLFYKSSNFWSVRWR